MSTDQEILVIKLGSHYWLLKTLLELNK